ncbi:hypothetical protein [Stieleria mannarensis]|uniref:hypothetical protein n=1 Tax=Stieleria mannarensis TaxID=2755585 RepID=UPI001602FE55|nr:hypothetical protein [Rhodopirellula sp. JC639]
MQHVHRASDREHRVVPAPERGDRSLDSSAVGMAAGWLIAEKTDFKVADRVTGIRSPRQPSPRCLQLATGQWCSPRWATWFPAPGPALRYASDLGLKVGDSVEIIFLKRDR